MNSDDAAAVGALAFLVSCESIEELNSFEQLDIVSSILKAAVSNSDNNLGNGQDVDKNT